jgi:hypothetical protein
VVRLVVPLGWWYSPARDGGLGTVVHATYAWAGGTGYEWWYRFWWYGVPGGGKVMVRGVQVVYRRMFFDGYG